MTLDDIVNAAIDQEGAGLDLTRARAEQLVNEVYKKMVVDSRWIVQTRDVALTVAGHATYPIPGAFIDLDAVFVADVPYFQPSVLNTPVAGHAGVFTTAYDADGGHLIQVDPVPNTDGEAVSITGPVYPTLLTTGTTPLVPDDVHSSLVDGTIATALRRMELRPQDAQPFEDLYREGTDKLKRRKQSQVRGPHRIRMAL